MKLLTKYNRINLLIMVVFFLLSSLAYYYLMNYLILRELDLNLSKIEKKIINYVKQYRTFPIVESLDDLHISYAETDQAAQPRVFHLIEPLARPGANVHSIRELIFFLELDHQWYKVTISRNLEGTNSFAKLVVKAAIVTILVVIGASLLVNRLVFRKLWKPFYASITALGHFQLGKKEPMQFPKTNIDEFDFLNTSLEKMTEKVEEEYVILREFTENASHEMQTPLAIIRSKLDLAIQDQHLSENQSTTLKSAYSAVKKLTNLNRSLLLLAKIENNQFPINSSINLRNKLEDKIVQFQELWKHKLEISYQLNESTIRANSDLIDILLNNLFSNASKHNIYNGNVSVELDCNSLAVKNTGKPAPLDESRLFKRFYKESTDSEHNGLGLAIVKQICQLSKITPSYTFSENMHGFILKWDQAGIESVLKY